MLLRAHGPGAAWSRRDGAIHSSGEPVGFKQRTLEEVVAGSPDYAIMLGELKVDRAQEEEQRHHPSPALPPVRPGDDHARARLPASLAPRRIVSIGYSERRIRGIPSLLAPGQPLGGEGDAFVRSIRFTPLR